MVCTRTFATLRIFSENIHPDNITEVLGITPTGTDPLNPESKYKSRRISNFWKYSTEEVSNSLNNVEHIEIILRVLKGRSNQMELLRQRGCQTDIFCYWDSSGQGGPSLSVTLMNQLVELGLDIYWDMYFDDEEDA